jgi:hypothetical protein
MTHIQAAKLLLQELAAEDAAAISQLSHAAFLVDRQLRARAPTPAPLLA